MISPLAAESGAKREDLAGRDCSLTTVAIGKIVQGGKACQSKPCNGALPQRATVPELAALKCLAASCRTFCFACFLLALALLAPSGCTRNRYRQAADGEVFGILGE